MTGLIQTLFPDAVIISHAADDLLKEATVKEAGAEGLTDEDLELWWRCIDLYFDLQLNFGVQEDYETSDEWVVGKVEADIWEIKGTMRKEGEDFDFNQVWAILLQTSVIAVVGDNVMLPLLIRKQDLVDEARRFLGRIKQG